MKSAAWILAGVLACLFTVGPIHATSDPAPIDPPTPAIDIGKCCGPFNCEAYLEVAAALQALPEAQRVTQLRVWAAAADRSQDRELREASIVLCRMLFEPTAVQPSRPPGSGAPTFVGYDLGVADAGKALLAALQPIELVKGIPFKVVRGYTLGGTLEPASTYLEYCLKETQWTSRRYAPAPREALDLALDQLLHQAWPRPLNTEEVKYLTVQTLKPPQPRLTSLPPSP